METITLINEKGGVGKTTLAVNLAAGLTLAGYRVLLVDADPQGSASVLCGVNPTPALYNLLVRDESFAVCSQRLPAGFWLVTSNVETRNIAQSIDNVLALRERLADVINIDVVIIDTSPTPSLLHGVVYMATDYMIYPTQLERLSFSGLANSLAHLERAQAVRRAQGIADLGLLGIVPMMYRANTAVHQANLATLCNHASFGQYVWDCVGLRTVWVEAAQTHKTIFDYAPDSEAAREMDNIVSKVVGSVFDE